MHFLKREPLLAGVLASALAMLFFVLVFMEPTRFELRAEGLSIDRWVADAFYWSGARRWTIDANDGVTKLLFYTGPKAVLIALGVALGLVALLPGRALAGVRAKLPWLPQRRDALYLTLCLTLIPLSCNRLKAVTNIYCPYEDTRYGGKAPYVRLWDDYPEDFKALQRANPKERGRGFPAGHASGGFALCAFAFAYRRRCVGVALSAAVGWWMGLYQMMKGAHYLSHTLVTWCVAWILACALAAIVKPSGWTEERA